MGVLRVLSAALCLAALGATAAEAAPQRVARGESFGLPAFAGKDVVYPAFNARDRIEVRRVRADGTGTVLAQMGKRAKGEERPFVVLAASPRHVAADRITAPGTDAFRLTETLLAGPLDGPLTELAFHCPGEANHGLSSGGAQPVAVDGTRLAYVRETCANGARDRRVVIRDLVTAAESGGLPTSGVGVALAGRYVAFVDPANPEALVVYDLEQGAVAYSVRASRPLAFDLQPDGKLVVAHRAESACNGIISWYSPAEPTAHTLNSCDGDAPVAIENDRVAYHLEGRLRVTQIEGATVTRRLAVQSVSRRDSILPFDGDHVVFATPGCSRDTGAVWVAAVSDPDTSMPRPRRCRVVWGTKGLRLDRQNRVTLRLSCPNGCRGVAYIEGRTRRFGGVRFELPARRSGTVRIRLRRASRLFGRARTVTAILHTFRDTTSESELGEDEQRVTLRR